MDISPQTAAVRFLNAVGHFVPQVQNEQVDADTSGLADRSNNVLCGMVVNTDVPYEEILIRKAFLKDLIDTGFRIFETRAQIGIYQAGSNEGASLHRTAAFI
jgi:hypothetical protein